MQLYLTLNFVGNECKIHITYKVFIQASGLACEVCVEVSLLHSLPTTVCGAVDSVVCQVTIVEGYNLRPAQNSFNSQLCG